MGLAAKEITPAASSSSAAHIVGRSPAPRGVPYVQRPLVQASLVQAPLAVQAGNSPQSHSPEGEKPISLLDSVGAVLSFSCAVHCMALPFVVTALPLLGLGFLAGSTFETVMVVTTLTLATTSFCWGVRLHGQRKTFLFLIAAVLFFGLGLHEFNHSHLSTSSSLEWHALPTHLGPTHLEAAHSAAMHGAHDHTALSSPTGLAHERATSIWHWIFMGIGGFALAFGHFLNHRLCKSCKACSHC